MPALFRQALFRQALFRQALFRQALFRQALFRQPLFRQALLVVNPLGERAITIRKAWESFAGGSEETSWLMKSLTGRVPKDRTIFRKRTIIHDYSSEGDQQKEYKEEKHALEMD
jgi:hypothetical protein